MLLIHSELLTVRDVTFGLDNQHMPLLDILKSGTVNYTKILVKKYKRVFIHNINQKLLTLSREFVIIILN